MLIVTIITPHMLLSLPHLQLDDAKKYVAWLRGRRKLFRVSPIGIVLANWVISIR